MPFLPAPPPAAAFTWQVTLAVLGISLLCSAAAYLIYFRLIADVGPTRTFTVTFLIPVFGTLWGALFLDEPVGMSTLAGGAVIVIATALVLEIGKRRAARSGGGAPSREKKKAQRRPRATQRQLEYANAKTRRRWFDSLLDRPAATVVD